MVIASCRLELSVPGATSLKDKRRVLSSVMERARHKFNISVAEVEAQELWQRAVIGIALVSGDMAFARDAIDRIVAFVEGNFEGEVCSVQTEFL